MRLKTQIKCYGNDGLIEAVGYVREDGSVEFHGDASRVREAIKEARSALLGRPNPDRGRGEICSAPASGASE